MLLHSLLWLVFVSDVLGLQCYSTDDLDSSATANQTLRDCDETFDKRKLAKTDFVLKCFTVSMPAAKPEVYYKGCFVGGCDIMKREIKRTTGYDLDKLECTECRLDGCNEAIPTGLGEGTTLEASVLTTLALLGAFLV